MDMCFCLVQGEAKSTGCSVCLPNVKDKDLIPSSNLSTQIQPSHRWIIEGKGTFSIIVIIMNT